METKDGSHSDFSAKDEQTNSWENATKTCQLRSNLRLSRFRIKVMFDDMIPFTFNTLISLYPV